MNFKLGDRVRFFGGVTPMIVKGIMGDMMKAKYENGKSNTTYWFHANRFVPLLGVAPRVDGFKVGDLVRTTWGELVLDIRVINPDGTATLKYVNTGYYRSGIALDCLVPIAASHEQVPVQVPVNVEESVSPAPDDTFSIFGAMAHDGAIMSFLGKPAWNIQPGDLLQDETGEVWTVQATPGRNVNLRVFVGAKLLMQPLR